MPTALKCRALMRTGWTLTLFKSRHQKHMPKTKWCLPVDPHFSGKNSKGSAFPMLQRFNDRHGRPGEHMLRSFNMGSESINTQTTAATSNLPRLNTQHLRAGTWGGGLHNDYFSLCPVLIHHYKPSLASLDPENVFMNVMTYGSKIHLPHVNVLRDMSPRYNLGRKMSSLTFVASFFHFI